MNKASSFATGPRAFPIGPHSAMTVVQDGAGDLRVAAGAATVMRLRLDERLDRLKILGYSRRSATRDTSDFGGSRSNVRMAAGP